MLDSESKYIKIYINMMIFKKYGYPLIKLYQSRKQPDMDIVCMDIKINFMFLEANFKGLFQF